ncbi:MAG: MerR family transcriptional regulator [Hespellia sp.]|nr:MerR family transcriptional regulator [Hespellia sp.]
MNTKQVEELTGLTRQNIRYYERMNLIAPIREAENSYRDYSEKDVEQLKLIKMLRMLDMPIEEIGRILHGEAELSETLLVQKEMLSRQQRQLRAAMEICDKIGKQRSEDISVESYLNEMEYLQNSEGGFAQIYNDYRQVAEASEKKQFSVYVHCNIYKEEEMWRELQNYAEENGISITRVKHTKPMQISVEGTLYEVRAAKVRQKKEHTPGTVILCTMLHPENASDAKIPRRRKRLLQMFYEIGRNINRQRGKSALAIAVCCMVVCFVGIYMGNVDSHKEQLEHLSDVYRITGEVRNSNGSLSEGLLISDEMSEVIRKSPYIGWYKETVNLDGVAENDTEGRHRTVTGVNQLEVLQSQTNGNYSWMDGMDHVKFMQEENVCVVDEKLLEKYQVRLGDELSFQISYYDAADIQAYTLNLKPLKTVTLRIVGSAAFTTTDVVCSLDEVKTWFQEAAVPYQASSFSFSLAKPDTLNSFVGQMKKAGFTEVSGSAMSTYKGYTLVLDDTDYINTAGALRKSIDFLIGFYPVLYALILLMGYMISYLLLQSRRLELAIMKSLGTGNHIITGQIFMEHMLLAVAGCVLGMGINLVMGFGNVWVLTKMSLLFLLCYGIGTMIALGMIRKIGVMAVLAGKE